MATQIQKDFDAFFNDYKPGQSVTVDGNKYVMGTGGNAQVIDSTGRTTNFTQSQGPQAIAAQSAAVQSSYNNKYTAAGDAGAYYQQRVAQAPNAPQPGGIDALNANLQANIGGMEGFSAVPGRAGYTQITTPSGRTYDVPVNADATALANHIPELAYAANQQYGTQFNVQPVGPSYFTNFVPQMQIGGVALQDMPVGSPERQRITDLYQQQYGIDPFNQQFQGPFDPTTNQNFASVRDAMGAPNTQAPEGLLSRYTSGPLTVGGSQNAIGPMATGPGQTGPMATGPGQTGPGQTGPFVPGGSQVPGGGQAPGGGFLGQAQIGEVATYNPYTNEVDYNELVQNRMADALDTPYANLQRKRALDEMNERGLLNSSLATQAADRASLDAALPIAQQDASTMTENRFRANDAINKALETNTASRNQMTKANMDALNAFGLDAQQFEQQRDLTATEHAQQMKLAEFDAGMRERLTQMSLNSEEFLQQNTLNQQDREFVIEAAASNNKYIMSAVSELQKIEGLTADQRATMMDELGGIHYANLQMIQHLTGVQIDWNSMGTGQAAVPTVDQNAETPEDTQPVNTRRDIFQDESTYT